MTDPRDLLDAARYEFPDSPGRLVLADRIRDDDGDTPAVATLLREATGPLLCCERCGCPETGGWVCWDQNGDWHYLEDAQYMHPEYFRVLFGGNVEAVRHRCRSPRVVLVRGDRWHLLCPHCARLHRRMIAARRKRAATRDDREAERQDREDAAPNLFSGVDDDGA